MQQRPPIQLVCATRRSQDEFLSSTLLGQSIDPFFKAEFGFEVRVFPDNREGLPAVYNRAIAESGPATERFVFVHDDVALTDLWWTDKVKAGLQQFHIVGLAGSRRRLPRQGSWAFPGTARQLDSRDHLSGRIGMGPGTRLTNVATYGPAPVQCMLLDGLFLAVERATLLATGLRFDERFQFHMYDVDFCRQAEALGLRLGTWPLSVIHASGGAVDTPAWQLEYRVYLDKYGE